MKAAIIGDIHANLPALNAVLHHARQQGVNTIWNLGDSVGYGAEPDQVVRRLREENAISILGNYDSRVLKFSRKKSQWREKIRPEAFLSLQWALENLSQVSREYLESLPKETRMRLGNTKILLTHGSPASNKERLTAATPDKRLRDLASKADAQLVICGHSHEPFTRKLKSYLFVNPGSVGRQSDGDPRASYAVLDFDPGLMLIDSSSEIELTPQFYRVEYQLEEAVKKIRQRGLPEAFAQMLIQGRDLEYVLREPEKWQVPDLEDQGWWISPYIGQTRQQSEDEKLRKVVKLAEKHTYNPDHVHQATHLALRLFDELQPLHRLGPDQRFWLRCGSLLHDIGKGKKNHHRKAMEMILKSKKLPFDARERNILGSIARYHRWEGPKDKHDNFTTLPVVDQRTVTILSAILRVADGLDASHRGNVINLQCFFSANEITIKCQVRDQAQKQRKRALGKGELMEFAFDRDLYIEWHRI
jgi:putative phosphoesterase